MGLMDTIKGWFGMAKEQGAEVAAKADPYVEKAKEQAVELADKTEDFAHDAMDKTSAGVDDFRSKGEASAEEAEEE